MKKLLVLLVLILTACQPSPEMIQMAMVQTMAAYTPTPEPTATETLMPLEDWRVTPMSGYSGLMVDTLAGEEWNGLEKKMASNLKIETPFRWDSYCLPGKTRFQDVEFYFTRILRERGYATEYNNYSGEKKAGLLIFTRPDMNVYVEFWDGNEESLMFVAYKEID